MNKKKRDNPYKSTLYWFVILGRFKRKSNLQYGTIKARIRKALMREFKEDELDELY